MGLTIVFFFVYWRLVVYPLSTIRFGEYLDIFKESFVVSLVISIPFYLILRLVAVPLWGQILLGALFALLYAMYYWYYRKDFVIETYKLVLNKKES